MGSEPFANESSISARKWEKMWAPYDEPTYQMVLERIAPSDVALEIGAGDLRLAYRLARQARWVYAIEINPSLAPLAPKEPIPHNLDLIWADAYYHPFPAGVTVAVLLMRHCIRFQHLVDKLIAIGCQRLITNARWRFGVEFVDLGAPLISYSTVHIGWYACRCGATGFVPGPAEGLTHKVESTIHQVKDCPACHFN